MLSKTTNKKEAKIMNSTRDLDNSSIPPWKCLQILMYERFFCKLFTAPFKFLINFETSSVSRRQSTQSILYTYLMHIYQGASPTDFFSDLSFCYTVVYFRNFINQLGHQNFRRKTSNDSKHSDSNIISICKTNRRG